jgi:shikimate kinase
VKRYRIAGMSGTGKSAVGIDLRNRGYHVIDTDDEVGLSTWVHRETNQPVAEPSEQPFPQAWLDEHIWVWNVAKLRELIADPTRDMIFFCGGAHNEEDCSHLFDHTFFLVLDDETLTARLQQREPQRWADGSPELQRVLEWNRTPWDPGDDVLLIDAARPIDLVAEDILRFVRDHAGPA